MEKKSVITNSKWLSNSYQVVHCHQKTISRQFDSYLNIMERIENLRIEKLIKLISPGDIRLNIPILEKSVQTIHQGRQDFYNIIDGTDNRFVVVVGPCSIHDPKAALEYACKLNEIREKLGDKLFILMRTYFEKPRTTVGWKGLINDPDLDGTNELEEGIKIARQLLIDITAMGMPVATELLDPIVAGYIAELVSWVAIGARTTESQTHRQMASGLSAPVGFKNNSDGNLDVAVNAMGSAKSSHSFLGVNDEGNCCVVQTKGNASTHIVLRGGNGRPNYHAEDIELCEKKLQAKNFVPKIMIDCSHENSGKNHERQSRVIEDVIVQKKAGNQSIFGVMIESNLFEGNQIIPENLNDLKYGVSITDGCIGWNETERLLQYLHEAV